MQNNQAFKEFTTEDEAKTWGTENYGQWLEHIQITRFSCESNDISDLLSGYSGSMNGKYNTMLRDEITYSKKEVKKYTQHIDIINREISILQLKENIIVWRWTSINDFKKLFKFNKINKGQTFADKAFMSTTLVADLLKNFAKERNYNCLLKLYLPKGTKGAYVDFFDEYHMLNECEFLLPLNTSFVLKKKCFSLRYMKMVYECYLVGQE